MSQLCAGQVVSFYSSLFKVTSWALLGLDNHASTASCTKKAWDGPMSSYSIIADAML